MMRISFTKAHGTRNDFLLTWTSESPRENTGAAARAICSRHTGIGADGVWAAMLRGLVESPVQVLTQGGPLEARWGDTFYLTGPAEIIGRGEFYFE